MLPLKKIHCPVDFSEPSLKSLKVAEELTEYFSGELNVVNVVTHVPTFPLATTAINFDIAAYEAELEKSAMGKLEEIAEKTLSNKIKYTLTILQGTPSGEIMHFADTEKADIIVIGTHGETGFRHFILGSVTERVVRDATCPVLTVHAG